MSLPAPRVMQALAALAASDHRLLYDLGELPDGVSPGKDIDILVRDQDEAIALLRRAGLREIVHPRSAEPRLYGAPACRMLAGRDGLVIDLHAALAVRSLHQGEWVPLDAEIQAAAWEEPGASPRLSGVKLLPPAVEFTYLLARCVFDKQGFPAPHRARLAALIGGLDHVLLRRLLEKVFFGFAAPLLQLVAAGRYDSIRPSFLAFDGY